jgi:hypothetical protein
MSQLDTIMYSTFDAWELILACRDFQGKNTLAYLSRALGGNEIFFIILTSGLYYKKLTIVNEAEDYRIVMTLLGSSDAPSSVPCIIKHSSRSVMTILESSRH